MIQIYDPGNEKFDFNGDVTLEPYSCDCTMILNDAWGLELEAPIDEDGKFLHIVKEAVISAPTPVSDKQLFRVYHVDKSDTSVIAFAMPIFFDSKDDHILLDVRPTGKNGQQALDIICAGSKYSGESNITKAATAYYIRKNLMEVINGDIDQSFLNRWGGEILYDNHKVIINERVGGDYGARAEFGYNLTGIEETVDMSEVVTRIIPVSYNGHTLDGSKPWVDSPNINKYQKIYTKVIEFSNVMLAEDSPGDNPDACATLAELRTKLIAECNKQFESGIDLPAISYDVRLESLKGVAGYEGLEILEDIGLGDDVKCKHRQLNVETIARATEIVYDCINRRNKEVKLGRFNQTALDFQIQTDKVVESITNPDGSIMAEKVQGILNGIYTQLKLQSTVAQKVEGRAFTVEDLDPDSDLFGCMTWGTQGLQLATKRTADGKDWDWTTAVTARGILADAIIAGILTDKTGKNYWNLDTGEFRLSGEAFKVDDQTVEDYVNGKIDNATAQIRLLTLQLTNDMCSVATEADGTGGDYSECYTDVMLLIGTTDITNSDKAQYTINPSSGVDGSWDLTRKRYTVRDMSGDNGSVTITATYAGITVSKVFSISKLKAGAPGSNGDSLESITEYYAVSSSNTIAPGQWYPNPPQMTEENRYLWNYETFIYSGGRTEDTQKRVIGAYGATGNGISSITNYYLATSQQSGVTISTYGWTTTPQTMTEEKKYLWNYEVFAYTDKPSHTVPPHIIGTYGDKGEDGRTYILQPDTLVIKQGANNVYTPRSVTFSSFYRDGTTASRTPYSGRFKIEESTDGTNYYQKYVSSYNESSYTYAPTSTSVKSIRCTLYASGGTNTPLDIQTIAVVRDVDNLTQEEIFNILTDNGRLQGIFMRDGMLYINGSYIKSGKVSGEYVDARNLTVTNSSGQKTLDIDANGNVSIMATTFSLSGAAVATESYVSNKTAQALSEAKIYADQKTGNLLKGSDLSTESLNQYWNTSGSIMQGQSDPDGGTKAVRLYGTSGDCFISARYSNNNPVKAKGQYEIRVWLKSNTSRTIVVSLNRVSYSCALTSTWKQFRFTAPVTTPNTQGYENFTIGGFASIGSGAYVYAYNPEVVHSYSPADILAMLTNNGDMDGIYMYNNQLYVKGKYIDVDDLKALNATIGGFTIGTSGIYKGCTSLTSTTTGVYIGTNGLRFYASRESNVTFDITNKKATFVGATLAFRLDPTYGLQAIINGDDQTITCKYGLHVYTKRGSDFSDGTDTYPTEIVFKGLPHITSGTMLVRESSTARICTASSSSKRYKDHIAMLKDTEAEKLLDIPVVWFKYKEGYLAKEDRFVDKPLPGFYAEDVYRAFPECAMQNPDTSVEDWNYRTLIPPMLKLIQNLYKEIKELKENMS